ncbi:hypothetical protein An03g05970 [Aspergillus niger]|uniref:Uncharacterized protein n=2 Tax=Aspergillus niger TaxID=5061 RepID=A2QH86_ASPNC|nr:hypothetical protein An03g05970 [Aspergillus niger]CAK38356.1 hypothetical protein An03g05970 [Aspergillus niger]
MAYHEKNVRSIAVPLVASGSNPGFCTPCRKTVEQYLALPIVTIQKKGGKESFHSFKIPNINLGSPKRPKYNLGVRSNVGWVDASFSLPLAPVIALGRSLKLSNVYATLFMK